MAQIIFHKNINYFSIKKFSRRNMDKCILVCSKIKTTKTKNNILTIFGYFIIRIGIII